MCLWESERVMRRSVIIVVAVLLAVLIAGTASVGLAAESGQQHTEDTTPGEQMSGVIGVQNAEFEGEITERGLFIALEQAETDAETAAVLEETVPTLEDRVNDLEDEHTALNTAHEQGNMSDGQYYATIAALETERAMLERVANHSHAAAGELPPTLLDEREIDVDHIQQLSERAGEMGGADASAIAREIAGPNVGEPMSDRGPDRGPPETPGPPSTPGTGNNS